MLVILKWCFVEFGDYVVVVIIGNVLDLCYGCCECYYLVCIWCFDV